MPKQPSDGLVRVTVGKTLPVFTPGPDHPIILSEKEWKRLFPERRARTCYFHQWEYRLGRPMGQFKVVYEDHIDESNLPSGRICLKCGKVEWVASKKATKRWEQKDFTP